jgi:hypothetical protein
MPPVMAWICRYRQHYPREYRQLPGGKPLLVVLMAFSVFLIIREVAQQIL